MKAHSSSHLKVLLVSGVLVETKEGVAGTSRSVAEATALSEQTTLPYRLTTPFGSLQVVLLTC